MDIPLGALLSAMRTQVLLSTIVLNIHTSDSIKIPCRALLHSGAESNFQAESLFLYLVLIKQN